MRKANNEGFRCNHNGTIGTAEHFEESLSALQANRVMGKSKKSNSDEVTANTVGNVFSVVRSICMQI